MTVKQRNKQKGGDIMPRKKDEKREKAKQIFLDSNGIAKNVEIAKILNVESAKISKWKYMDKWQEALENKPKKRGAPKGNKNARGHGAPKRNRNAQTHGAYSTVYFDELTDTEKELIESITLNTTTNMQRELQTLVAKEYDLKKKIKALDNSSTGELFIDRVVEMRTPKKADDNDPYGEYTGKATNRQPLNIAMETTVRSSAFERQMRLETELNKVRGRIIKLIDSIKSYELEQRRIALEEKRYELMKQKASGVYEVDPDTGQIDDTFKDPDI